MAPWCPEALIKATPHCFRILVLLLVRGILHRDTFRFGHLVEQEMIDAGADAIGKHPGIRVLLNFRDDLHVIADIAIGEKYNDANIGSCGINCCRLSGSPMTTKKKPRNSITRRSTAWSPIATRFATWTVTQRHW
jgi:hypothetical protein